MSKALILAAIALACILLWLTWRLGTVNSRRHRAIRQLLDAADALEARLRDARDEIEAIAGGQVNPVQTAMQNLLQQRLWLQQHAHDASLQQLNNVRQSLDEARASLEQQLERVAQARSQAA